MGVGVGVVCDGKGESPVMGCGVGLGPGGPTTM